MTDLADIEKTFGSVDTSMRVHSHPRSGTHYLMAVLNENFIHAENYYDVYWNAPLHGFPDRYKDYSPDIKRFYIWRGFEGVARSFLKPVFGAKMGIRGDMSLDEFRDTPWSELFTPGVPWKIEWEGAVLEGTTHTKQEFHTESRTPYEYWKQHTEDWLAFASGREDVYVVQYERLLSDFQKEMRLLAEWLGFNMSNFTSVERQVGYSLEKVS